MLGALKATAMPRYAIVIVKVLVQNTLPSDACFVQGCSKFQAVIALLVLERSRSICLYRIIIFATSRTRPLARGSRADLDSETY